MHEYNIKIAKLGFPSDTQFLNYGLETIQIIATCFVAALLTWFLIYYALWVMILLYKILLQKDYFFLSNEHCHVIWEEFKGEAPQFE